MSKETAYAARKAGTMKLFPTEKEAYEYADNHSSIAKYESDNGVHFTFVEVVGLKTDADTIARILQG